MADRKSGAAARRTRGERTTPAGSGRYTPPVPKEEKVSAPWVPVLMFALLALGTAVIILNYLNVMPGDEPSNLYLVAGLGSITLGFVVATNYH